MTTSMAQQPVPAASSLGPRALGDIFGDTFGIYRRNFWRLSAITAVYLVPLTLLGYLLGAWGASLPVASPQAILASACLFLLFFGVFLVISILAPILGYGALVQGVSEQILQGTVDIGRAYSFSRRRLLSLFGATILYSLAIGAIVITILGAWFLVLLLTALAAQQSSTDPGAVCLLALVALAFSFIGFPVVYYLSTRWAFYRQAVVLEGAGARAALSRSGELVKGTWWRVFGILFSAGIVNLLIAIVLGLVLGLPLAIAGTGLGVGGDFILQIINTVVSIPTTTIGGIWATLLYFDLRVRKEGLTAEQLASALGMGSAQASGAS